MPRIGPFTLFGVFAAAVAGIAFLGMGGNESMEKLPAKTDGTEVARDPINDFDISRLGTGIYKGTINTSHGEPVKCFIATDWSSERGYGGVSCDFSAVRGEITFPENATMQVQKISNWGLDRLNDGMHKLTITEANGARTECIASHGWEIDRGYAGLSCNFK